MTLNKVILISGEDITCNLSLVNLIESLGYDYVIEKESITIPELCLLEPNLIVINYNLPSGSGGQLCLKVKRNTDTRHISVVLFSEIKKLASLAADYCADGYLICPINVSYAKRLIRKLIH